MVGYGISSSKKKLATTNETGFSKSGSLELLKTTIRKIAASQKGYVVLSLIVDAGELVGDR